MTDKGAKERTKISQKQTDPKLSTSNSLEPQGNNDQLEIQDEPQKKENPQISSKNETDSGLTTHNLPFLFQKLNRWDSFRQNQLNQYYPHYFTLFELLDYIKSQCDSNYSQSSQDHPPKITQSLKILVQSSEGHELLPFLYTFARMENLPFYFLDFSNHFAELASNLNQYLDHLVQNFKIHLDQPFILAFPLEGHVFDGKNQVLATCINLINSLSKHYPSCINVAIIGKQMVVPTELASNYDICLNFLLPDETNRQGFLKSLLAEYPEEIFDCDHLSLQMKEWNYVHMRNFISYSQHLYQAQQFNKTQKNQKFDSNYLIQQLESQRFVIPIEPKQEKFQQMPSLSNGSHLETQSTSAIKNQQQISARGNKSLELQLYQDAASTNYEDLCITIDKLAKGMLLQPYERTLLAEFAFILRDEPKRALQKLNKAKIAIDKILHLT